MKVVKLCEECRWFRDEKCDSPNNIEEVDLVHGKVGDKRKLIYCISHRTGDGTNWLGCRILGFCGKEGRWFEKKEVQNEG